MKFNHLLPFFVLLSICVTSCTNASKESSLPFVDKECGYQKQKMTMINQDLDHTFAPALGEVKMLIIPIEFGSGTYTKHNSMSTWSATKIQNINKYYFGENNSLKSYYETSSFNQMTVSGMVSDIYVNDSFTVDDLIEDDSYELLFDLIETAVTWVENHYPSIDWKEYDLNSDGCLDNVHLITNYNSTVWAETLWPHMYYTNRNGTIEKPLANVYSLSGLSFFTDAITAIHEQGHIFGLQDYYDYSYMCDYVGGADMQSENVFDWNSFSKISTGWVDPYVINGTKEETTITISAASLNGDCLLIPANFNTWNGSAFDEYFLIELFAPFGNNQKDWNRWSNVLDKGGIRMYHVDARAFGSNKATSWNPDVLVVDDLNKQEINKKEDVKKYSKVTIGATNTYTFGEYEGGIEQFKDYKLLCLIQRNATDTFGSTKDNARHSLHKYDFFREGDVFTFEKYAKFLSKTGKNVTTMDNGEIFPYEISFDKVSSEEATITVRKVK